MKRHLKMQLAEKDVSLDDEDSFINFIISSMYSKV